MNNPGFTAMFCTYFVIDVPTGKVISVVVANKRQARMFYGEKCPLHSTASLSAIEPLDCYL